MKRYFKIFLLVFFVLTVILLLLGIYPFGDKTLIVIDLRDQYLTFINYLKSITFDGNSLFYTLSGSLGESFIPLASYYLMSIFNVFTLPFKGDLMPLVLTFIIVVKISLSSVTMLYFLDKKYGNKDINYLFAISYGLMSYNMAFFFHIMWLDAIILLPLVALGIENIFNKHRIKLYLISLSLTILSNYYIGVIVCIFSVIYFIYYYLINYNKKFDLKKIIYKYISASFLSGMVSMIVLLPTIFSLQNGKTMVSGDLALVGKTFNSIEILSKTLNLSFDSSSIWHGGPNIFVGTLVILLMVLYFTNKKINKKNRIISAIFVLLLFLTCRIHSIDLIFHGMNEPNCFDYRQAFIISFFFIIIGYEGFKNFKKFEKKNYLLIGIILFHLIIYLFNLSYFRERVLFLIFSLVLFIIFIYLIPKKNYKLLFVIVAIDLVINAVNIISTITLYEESASSISEYHDYYIANSNAIDKVKRMDNSFYRLEKDYHHSNNINDSMMYNYRGISHFDSTTNANTEKLLENLGFRRVVTRAFYDKGSTRAVDMLLGIKYVLSKDNHFDYQNLFNINRINVLKNPHFVSPVFLFDNTNNITYTDNVFDNLNLLFNRLTGISNLYKKTDYVIKYNNVLKEGNTYYKKGNNAYLEYQFTPVNNENYYLYFKDNLVRDNYKTADIYINNLKIEKYFTKYNYGMINLGKLKDNVTIKIVLNDDSITFDDGLLYYEDNLLFDEIYHKLNNNSNIVYENSKYKITINNVDSKNVLLTIPYEEGFNISVDNQKVDYVNYAGFISFPLSNGNHEILVSFVSRGFKMGLLISVISIGISGIMIYKERYEKEN